MPLRSDGVLELFFGNNTLATGSSNQADLDISRIPHPGGSASECARLNEVGELAYMRHRQAEAMAWIQENPGRFAELTVRRFQMFWFPGSKMFNQSTISIIKILGFGANSLFLFVEIGRLAFLRHPSLGFVAACVFGESFMFLVTHVDLRYRLPVHSLSALLAADAVVAVAAWLPDRWREFFEKKRGTA